LWKQRTHDDLYLLEEMINFRDLGNHSLQRIHIRTNLTCVCICTYMYKYAYLNTTTGVLNTKQGGRMIFYIKKINHRIEH
jgi:hypothetical protein